MSLLQYDWLEIKYISGEVFHGAFLLSIPYITKREGKKNPSEELLGRVYKTLKLYQISSDNENLGLELLFESTLSYLGAKVRIP